MLGQESHITHLILSNDVDNIYSFPVLLDWLSNLWILVIDDKDCLWASNSHIKQLQLSTDFGKLAIDFLPSCMQLKHGFYFLTIFQTCGLSQILLFLICVSYSCIYHFVTGTCFFNFFLILRLIRHLQHLKVKKICTTMTLYDFLFGYHVI